MLYTGLDTEGGGRDGVQNKAEVDQVLAFEGSSFWRVYMKRICVKCDGITFSLEQQECVPQECIS